MPDLFTSAVMFIGGLLASLIVYLYVTFKSFSEIKEYLTKTREGKGILAGIVKFIGFGLAFVAVALAVALFSPEADASEVEGKWFAYGEVYLGLEWPKADPSPQCYPDGADSRGTSNGGLRLNVYQSADERSNFNFKYSHHSCALNKDRNHYDAVGFEWTYRFFSR